MCFQRIIGRLFAAAFLTLISVLPIWATSHVFVRNAEGVWLASDSLVIHNDGVQVTALHACKVTIARNQLLFNTGKFRDLKEFMRQQAALPFAGMAETLRSVAWLLSLSHQDTAGEVGYDPDAVIVSTGILQVENSVFRAKMFNQADDLKWWITYVKEDFKMGVPHGYGDAVHEANQFATLDGEFLEQLIANPKRELLKILAVEAAARPNAVAGPYTVLLLHPDGTVSDFSDEPLCSVPASARH